jgi:hypothetical protein
LNNDGDKEGISGCKIFSLLWKMQQRDHNEFLTNSSNSISSMCLRVRSKVPTSTWKASKREKKKKKKKKNVDNMLRIILHNIAIFNGYPKVMM